MNRTSVLLCILSGLALTLYILNAKEDSSIKELSAERAFAIKDESDIYKVVISQRNSAQVILQKNKPDWTLNGKYLARQNAIKNLLEVLTTVRISYIPERTATENILKEMSLIGVQVDVYNKNLDPIKSYVIGGSTPDERGTYFLMAGSNQPFVMHIPTIEGSVRGRFIYKEADWRDRAIFKENPKDIKSISVRYSESATESFKIERLNKVFLLEGEAASNVNKSKLKAYVESFDEVYAEYIDNENVLRDSISQLVPFCTISVTHLDDSQKTVKFYPLTNLLYEEKVTTKEELLRVDGRYFADCSWGDFMLVQQRLIAKLLLGKSQFLE